MRKSHEELRYYTLENIKMVAEQVLDNMEKED